MGCIHHYVWSYFIIVYDTWINYVLDDEYNTVGTTCNKVETKMKHMAIGLFHCFGTIACAIVASSYYTNQQIGLSTLFLFFGAFALWGAIGEGAKFVREEG